MTLIIDASALIAWVMPDETGLDLDRALAVHNDVIAPWLLWIELRNILLVSERRGRLSAGMAEQIIEPLEGLGILLDTSPSSQVVMELSRRHGLTAYDAVYLECALRHGGVLATLDQPLSRAAKAEGVATIS